ncbi:Transcriptional regulator PadR family protein [[Clostridium] ultunense Esp]|uniref:Transcriptional regulator PadR family protein n=1 Tax=[Clostridium] ultunense Esp TaxID=1288971 RepID=M1ZG57_9FIRM|nr:PadR family transcriptional regulator [Schnuerera ultunensis]CCQ97203.1 Transcriptional regulator PadR family protein [[Clostridium] ultunense Esp]SHD75713.1 Transcriptional regulator PadR family protein [[Clostridium] ultunense Esp]
MQDKILRRLFLGFIQIHILHHAKEEPFYGSWMMQELEHHGYEISAGTLYPILHNMEKNGLLTVENQVEDGKMKKYYSITKEGCLVLNEAKIKIRQLIDELL